MAADRAELSGGRCHAGGATSERWLPVTLGWSRQTEIIGTWSVERGVRASAGRHVQAQDWQGHRWPVRPPRGGAKFGRPRYQCGKKGRRPLDKCGEIMHLCRPRLVLLGRSDPPRQNGAGAFDNRDTRVRPRQASPPGRFSHAHSHA